MSQRRTLLNHALVHQMRRTIEQYDLLDRQSQRVVIIALSGGADSTALLWGLSLLGYRCVAAHCNFHLRGEESDRDEAFVTELCDKLGVTLERASFDTYGYAAAHKGVSVEMAARELRYDFFDELYVRYDAQCIALGHHLEDNVEQLLINLSQGAGVRGLRGMLPVREEGKYIRPLIDTPPRLIYDFLRIAEQPFVTDSTNADTTIRRNFVRHTLRPLFDQLNPSFDQAVASTIHILRDLEQLQDYYIKSTLPADDSLPLGIAWLRQQIAPLALLYSHFATIDCDRLVLQQLLMDCSNSKRADSYARYEGHGGIIERYRGYLIGTTSETLARLEQATNFCLELPAIESWQAGAVLDHPLGSIEIAVHDSSEMPPPAIRTLTPYSYLVDYDQLRAAMPQLQLSASTDGEQWVAPLGMKERKPLAKLLRDAKVLPSRRAATVQLIDNHTGTTLWLVGVCRSADYQLTPQTRRWAEITFTPTLSDPFARHTELHTVAR